MNIPESFGIASLAANYAHQAKYREARSSHRAHSDKMVLLAEWADILAVAWESDEARCRKLGFVVTDDEMWFRDYLLVNEHDLEQYAPRKAA